MRKYLNLWIAAAVLCTLSSCLSVRTVRPGEIAIKQRFGKLGEPRQNGLIVFSPLTTRVLKIPTRTVNRELLINLPSKEGLTIQSEISILYRIQPSMAKNIVIEVGTDFDQLITSVFRSASADVTAKYFAKDMHSGERDKIEKDIAAKMNEILNARGFVIESVLMKSISLPPGLAKAIESKLEAEQQAQRMEFILQAEQKEAERKKIEAIGTRDAQIILSEGLTDRILRLRQIEVMKELVKSPNAKVIISGDRENPVLISEK